MISRIILLICRDGRRGNLKAVTKKRRGLLADGSSTPCPVYRIGIAKYIEHTITLVLDNQSTMTRKCKFILMPLAAGAFLIALLYPAWCVYWRVPGWIDYQLHYERYAALLREIKSRPAPEINRIECLTIDGIRVYSRRSAENDYAITLETADWGHFGCGGYVYYDKAPLLVHGDPYRTADAPGDEWTLGCQVDRHWWVVTNNLN